MLCLILGLIFLGISSRGCFASQCPSQGRWKAFQNHCYQVVIGYPESAKSWYDAEDYCRLQNATLASIHSSEENSFIWTEIKRNIMVTDRVWLGLNSLSFPGKFYWSDGSPVDYQIWAQMRASNKCVAMKKDNGEWLDINCGYLQGFVCKRQADSVVPIPPPIHIYVPEGNCPATWYQFGPKCYKFFGDTDQERVTWKQAKETCQALGENHYLVSIHSEEEQMFLTSLLGSHNYDTWIGLERSYTSRLEMWSDNSRYNYTNWIPGTGGYYWVTQCPRLMSSNKTAGRWKPSFCDVRFGYVCQSEPNPDIKPPIVYSDCQKGYLRYGKSCYGLIKEKRNWTEAEKGCQKDGGHLVSVNDMYENAFLFNFIDIKEELWIGLKDERGDGRFEWSDGWPILFLNWKQRPTRFGGRPSCVYADNSTRFWHNSDCGISLPYICKVTEEKKPIIPIKKYEGKCPSYWNNSMDFGGRYCYHIGQTASKYWASALEYCTKQDAKLASFHSIYETELLWPLIGNDSTKMWIGLYKHRNGTFVWQDGSAVDFINWDPSERRDGECVYMSSENMMWIQQKCEDAYRFANPLCIIEKELL